MHLMACNEIQRGVTPYSMPYCIGTLMYHVTTFRIGQAQNEE